jgi:hypothetical protein
MPSRPARLPADVAPRLGLPSSERVVAWGRGVIGPPDPDAAFIVVTDRALYLEPPVRRIPWHRITKATWEEPLLSLAVLDDAGRAGRPFGVRITDARDVPAAVYDRVTASVVVSERADLDGGGSALLVARRGGDDGEITWSVVFDAGVDPSDPARRRSADAALRALRDALGI